MDEYAYVVNGDAVVVRDGEYLLIERAEDEEHAAGMLAFPGGKVEQASGNDDPIEATSMGFSRQTPLAWATSTWVASLY